MNFLAFLITLEVDLRTVLHDSTNNVLKAFLLLLIAKDTWCKILIDWVVEEFRNSSFLISPLSTLSNRYLFNIRKPLKRLMLFIMFTLFLSTLTMFFIFELACKTLSSFVIMIPTGSLLNMLIHWRLSFYCWRKLSKTISLTNRASLDSLAQNIPSEIIDTLVLQVNSKDINRKSTLQGYKIAL